MDDGVKQLIGPHAVLLNGYPIAERQSLSEAYQVASWNRTLPWSNGKDNITVEWNKSMEDCEREAWNKLSQEECRELPAKQLQEFKELIIPDIMFVCGELGDTEPSIDISARNWLCAQVDITLHDISMSFNAVHQTQWKDGWLESPTSRREYIQIYLTKNPGADA